MASSPQRTSGGIGAPVFTLIAVIVLGTIAFWWIQYGSSRRDDQLALSPEAKQYVAHLKLSDVAMKATESYVKQRVVEIQGKITNAGDRTIQLLEVYCIFYDPYGQVVLRTRLPIVKGTGGPLKPGETRAFRLPFDDIPESWNQQLPQLVIAGIKFS